MLQLILLEKVFPIGNVCASIAQNAVVSCLVPPRTFDPFAELNI